ncbi:response regulator [Terasakiella sp. A23]|uniref:response regulator n=1 Tax=Terasakiella sp. FCG-A23 TaxID=3080561 RepID=UPI002954D3D6|nr:response regulator [Terasakiella sp. A23]MDV7341174.1 response regulator [Terasakiella sp. A23]
MANILVADDMAEILFVYEETLRAAGHTVVTATNGKEANRYLDTEDFDLVVTDLLMPKVDGVEVATHAHSLENTPKLLVITGGGDRISPHEALKISEVFFDATLIKPVSQDELLNMVDKLLAERH